MNKKPRILFMEFITSVGGVQKVLLNILPGLKEHFDIDFIDAYNNKLFRSLLEKTKVNRIECCIWPRIYAIGWAKFYKRIIAIFILSYFYFIYLLRVYFCLKDRKIDLIYTNSKKGLIFSYFLKYFLNIPILYHAHGFGSEKDITLLMVLCLKKVSFIICVSEYVKQILIRRGIDEKYIKVIYNGVNEIYNNRNQRPEVNYELKRPITKILLAGSLQWNKGIHVAIEAAHILKKKNFSFILYIAGEVAEGGEISYKKYLNNLVERWKLQKKVVFLGWVNNVHLYMEEANIVILPSINEESFGLAIAEAMYFGKPVIGSNIGGLKEVIKDKFNGFLIEPGDSMELAEKIMVLGNDNELRNYLGNNGRNLVRSKFNIKFQIEQIVYVVGSILQER